MDPLDRLLDSRRTHGVIPDHAWWAAEAETGLQRATLKRKVRRRELELGHDCTWQLVRDDVAKIADLDSLEQARQAIAPGIPPGVFRQRVGEYIDCQRADFELLAPLIGRDEMTTHARLFGLRGVLDACAACREDIAQALIRTALREAPRRRRADC